MSDSPEEMLDRVREIADDYAEWEVFSSYSEALKYVLGQAALYREVCKQRQADQARIAELEAELDRKSAEQNQAYLDRMSDLSGAYIRAQEILDRFAKLEAELERRVWPPSTTR